MSINKVIILGRLGRDPEVKTMPNGNQLTSIAVATSERYTDKQGQKQEQTEWHNVTFFGKQAEVIAQYFHKGSPIYLEGKLKTDKWQTPTGENRYATRIIGNSFSFVPQEQGQGQSTQQAKPQTRGWVNPEEQPFNDDIPF